jgi:hypothetical protein
VLMRLSVPASLRLNHAIHQGNHRLDRPLHISTVADNAFALLVQTTCATLGPLGMKLKYSGWRC